MKFIAHGGIKPPVRATQGSAGYDIYSPREIRIMPHEIYEFDTCASVDIDDPRIVLKLYVRSSLGRKGITLTNSVGIIDSDYKDHIHAFLINTSDQAVCIEQDQRYMQGIFERYYLTDDDDVKAVRTGGLGSTGK